MTDREEQIWLQGNKAAYNHILNVCMKVLGGEDLERAGLISERVETIAALRRVCREHGDASWPEDLHLVDIIEKYLEPYLTK